MMKFSFTFMVSIMLFVLPIFMWSGDKPQAKRSAKEIMAEAQRKARESVRIQKEEMKKVQWLHGKWHGTGWYMMGPGKKSEFSQQETVVPQLNGLIMSVEGVGKEKGGTKIIHHAYAVFSYDPAAKSFKVRAYKIDGYYTEATGSVDEKGRFIWGFDMPHGKVRFTITHTPKGEWHELGEFSRDGGKSWYKTLEMTLKKE